MADFIGSLGIETPWHISRFHPQYKMLDLPVTPYASIERAYEIGKAAGLKYVYTGNVPGDTGENTLCAHCGEILIERYGFHVRSNKLVEGDFCPRCRTKLDGIF
jgi:pyruvate formate lyase activating enzyme